MAYSITSMKAFAFSDEDDLKFSEERKESLRRFAVFNIQLYIPHFFMASNGSDAAHNDLILYKKLLKFRDIDKEIAEEAIKTLSRHLWYLTPLNIPIQITG